MSYFGYSNWDYLFEEIKDFLKNHNISDLLEIVTAAIKQKEEGEI